MYEDKTIERGEMKFIVRYEPDDSSSPTDFGGEFTSKFQEYAIDRKLGVMLGAYETREQRFDSYLEATRWLDLHEPLEEEDWEEDEDSEAGTLTYGGHKILASDLGRTAWERGSYQYYMPPVENYKGCTEEEIIKYCLQDWRRTEDYGNGWVYMGCIVTMFIDGEEVAEASLWGLESDGDTSYFEEIEGDLISKCVAEAKAKVNTYRTIAEKLEGMED